MPPRKVAVDYPYSFAHRTGGALRIVLDLAPSAGAADVDLDGEPPVLHLRKERRTVRATARVTQHGQRLRLEATVPWSKLRPGVWRLAMHPAPDQAVRPLKARLLVSRKQPVALLPGGAPRTRLDPPRTADETSPPRRVFEAAVSRLPERPASRVRSAAGSVYRRVRS